jgi:hypothetical protein
MKTLISNMILLTVSLLTPQITPAQGTTYVSNLGQASIGNNQVGSDSWIAASFSTGTNASGYSFNSVELGMTAASGSPSNFTAMIYSGVTRIPGGADYFPGSSLDTLDGSLNPLASGIYNYTDDSNIVLSPSTVYFIVLTAGTAVATGAYGWSYAGSYNPSGGWSAPYVGGAVDIFKSSDGSSWTLARGNPQFSITATPAPEPSPSLLLLLGSGIFIYARRAFRI